MGRMTEIPVVDLGGGTAMPMVGFGTWQLQGPRAYEAIRRALTVGYRHIPSWPRSPPGTG
jgi:2,5-diketo-D-gluconate reductase A